VTTDQKLDAILHKVNRVEAALYPDADSTKPSRVTALEKRVSTLELWRSGIIGAWTLLLAAIAYIRHK
jgi:hypothetical protein